MTNLYITGGPTTDREGPLGLQVDAGDERGDHARRCPSSRARPGRRCTRSGRPCAGSSCRARRRRACPPGVLAAEQDVHLAEVAAVVEDVVDQRPQRGDAEAAGDDQQVVPLQDADRETLAVGPADADLVARLEAVQRAGHLADRPDADLEGGPDWSARRQIEMRDLADAEERDHDELPRLVVEARRRPRGRSRRASRARSSAGPG